MERTQTQLSVNEFIRSVYNWMAIGLLLTGFVAYYVSNSESLLGIVFGNRLIFFGLIAAELILVFSLVARAGKLRASSATAMFILYSALNGITLSAIFLIYTRSLITSTFFISAATFIACSIYGMTSKTEKYRLWSWRILMLPHMALMIFTTLHNSFAVMKH